MATGEADGGARGGERVSLKTRLVRSLFRAVAEQVYGDAEFCDRVREQTVSHMSAMRAVREEEENKKTTRSGFSPQVYSQFVPDEAFDDYLNRMRRNGEVADHPEIQGESHKKKTSKQEN